MVEIKFTAKEEKDANKMAEMIHEGLQGWKPYIDSEVIITPTEKDNDGYCMHLVLGPGKEGPIVEITV